MRRAQNLGFWASELRATACAGTGASLQAPPEHDAPPCGAPRPVDGLWGSIPHRGELVWEDASSCRTL